MGLEGTLESFSIGEIFQLIAQQGKSGVLEIATPEGVAKIRFVQGQVLDAAPPSVDPTRHIGMMLVGAGYITDRQLEHALGTQRKNMRKLGDVLIRMGVIRTTEFMQMLALQRRETAYGLLRLKRGSYAFRPGTVDMEEGVDTLLPVDAILMEGSRQIDEWPQILQKIPSEGRVYKRNAGPAPVGDLSEEEVIVLGLVDGTYTVREIVNRSRLGEFPAWDALAKLYDAGLISPMERSARRATPRGHSGRSLPAVVIDGGVAVLLVVLAGFVIYVSLHGRPERLRYAVEGVRTARVELKRLEERSTLWAHRTPVEWPAPLKH